MYRSARTTARTLRSANSKNRPSLTSNRSDGDNWKKLTDFTVPDNGNWGNMQLEQLSGDKNVWMQVPTEILGQSVAWIRLRPVQNKIGTATTYDTATIASNGQVANAFTVSYAALRYNK